MQNLIIYICNSIPAQQQRSRAGLLDLVSSDDELAGILAHEMAHVLARHSAEQLTRNAFVVAAAAAVEALTGVAAGGNLVATAAQLALTLPNSRRCETEADAVGVALAARACYDPEGLSRALAVRCLCPVNFVNVMAPDVCAGYEGSTCAARVQALEKLEQRQGGGAHNPYLSTHPATGARVHATRALAAEARRTLDLGECEQYRQALRWGGSWGGAAAAAPPTVASGGGGTLDIEIELPPSGGWR